MDILNTNPELIQHYDLLKRTGLIDHINALNTEINTLEELFSEAWEIAGKHSIDEILECVVEILLDKFVPTFFTVILQDRMRPRQPKISTYKNLQPYTSEINAISLEPFRDFFSAYPNPISFSLLEYKLENPEASESLKIFSPEIVVPILGFWGLYGLIIIGPKLLDQEYTPKETAYINRLMKFTSIGIQNNIHHQSSITDLKTGLYNHSFFLERLEEELARVKRHDEMFALLMIDIDHFKKFNDTYGHLAGDKVLTALSKILLRLTRREDVAARFGGEEFILLITQTQQDTAWFIAERIRTTIADETVAYGDQNLHVTVSIGIRHVSTHSHAQSASLIEETDEALYKSKKGGRNKTTFYNPGLLLRASILNK